MSTAMIRLELQSRRASITMRPTVLMPKTAETLPSSTWAVLNTAPSPIGTEQLTRQAFSGAA
eukprot:scaffold666066_cov79-Prasinocladus_malaysianus.AAC.1